jgi:hypothetical protein
MFVTKKKYKELEEKYKLLQKEFENLVEFQFIPYIERVEILKDKIEAEFGGPREITDALTSLLTQSFMYMNIENYTETTFNLSIGKQPNCFVCTVQKCNGKSPHQLRREAEEKVKVLEDKLSKLEK